MSNNRTHTATAGRILTALLVTVTTLAAIGTSPSAAATGATAKITPRGDLVITGTADTDEIRVLDEGIIEVYDGSTQIGEWAIEDFKRDLIINLGNGNDLVMLDGVHVHRDFKVNMGNDNDQFLIEDMSVDRHFRYSQGRGQSRFLVERSTFEGTTTIRTGTGLDSMQTQRNVWKGNFSVTSSPAGQIGLVAADDDYHRNYRFRGSNHSDELRLLNDSNFHGTVNIDLRNGDDELDVGTGVHVYGRITARLGSGHDTANLYYATFRHLVNYDLGSGDDFIALLDITVNRRSLFNGGSGDDIGIYEEDPPNPLVVLRSLRLVAP